MQTVKIATVEYRDIDYSIRLDVKEAGWVPTDDWDDRLELSIVDEVSADTYTVDQWEGTCVFETAQWVYRELVRVLRYAMRLQQPVSAQWFSLMFSFGPIGFAR